MCQENIEIYEKIIEDGPTEFLNGIQEAMTEAGESLEEFEESDERCRELVKRALAGRNLTPEEEIIKEEMERKDENCQEEISTDKSQNTLRTIFILIFSLVILLVTFKILSKKNGGEDSD